VLIYAHHRSTAHSHSLAANLGIIIPRFDDGLYLTLPYSDEIQVHREQYLLGHGHADCSGMFAKHILLDRIYRHQWTPLAFLLAMMMPWIRAGHHPPPRASTSNQLKVPSGNRLQGKSQRRVTRRALPRCRLQIRPIILAHPGRCNAQSTPWITDGPLRKSMLPSR
jgi:hypothetical protein